MMTSGYNIRDIIQEAQSRWLRPGEVLFVLQNYEENQLNHEPPQKPPSGSLFLFNKRVLRFFRKDGHSWRKKKDGKNVGEAHERLKVGNIEALNCYYAHGDQNPDFQRRSYWMLDPAMEHIVLVHYRDITIGRHSAGPVSTPLGSSNIIKSSNSYATQLSLSATGGLGSVEASPDIVTKSNGASRLNLIGNSPSFEVDQALQMKQQLSLDHLKDIDTFYRENEHSNNLGFTVNEQNYSGSGGLQDGSNNYLSQQYPASILLPQELEDLTFPAYISARNTYESDPDIYLTLFDQEQMGTPIASDSSLTIAQEQKFTIREISPEWGYANESTKALVIGTFTCDPSKCEWFCMFGDTEVPVEIIQEGVICCQAPPRLPGKVTICITSGNREACSEVREFEYRDKPNIYVHNNNLTEKEPSRGSEELLLLVKFVQLLLSNQVGQSQKGESQRTRIDLLESSRAGEDSWAQVIDAISDESLVSSRTTDWLLEELLKDKLQWWISSKLQDNNAIMVLSKREQGIIHIISGLGFVWALTPILKCGVGVNFRDVNGWTALHWAARFGREKMVAELLASGAYAGAVTDPSRQDPTGQTPASMAATYGHKGLAAYLSEIALTSHLSSLTLQETELSRCSADVEAESTVNTISDQNLVINEDHLSLKDATAAVRNTIQAASRIQAAFRAHSFKKRKQKEAAECDSGDEYGFLSSEIEGLSASSKFTFGSARDHNAALSIQKKYRGWKGRKDFLTLRQKVVKIQAHVRGHQARKNYETICWAVSLVEKIILRWHRKGVGLRGFHVESLDENEDVVKVFRKQKVDVALSEAVSRVLSMVNSQQARQQYRRMLQKYRQAKAERGGLENEGGSTSQGDITSIEDDVYDFM